VLHVPPLRARREDLVTLLVHALGDPPVRLGPALVEALLLHPFPFNVREVQAIASQLRLRGRGRDVLDLDLVLDRLATPPSEPPSAPADDDPPPPDRAQLEELLRTHRGVIADVARAMNRSRKQVYRWIEQHALDVTRYR
jgi:DNA-binding NtrC family response regulator